MQTKALLVALAALSSITDAAVARRKSPFTSALQRRQFGGNFDGGFGGGNGGNNNNDNGQDDGQDGNNNDGNNNDDNNNDGGNNNGGGGNGDLALDPEVVQEGSQQDGNANAEDGQAPSAT